MAGIGEIVALAKGLGGSGGGGSSGGVLVVNVTWGDTTATLDKTWQEIHDAGWGVVKNIDGNGYECGYIFSTTELELIGGGAVYSVNVYSFGIADIIVFSTQSASGYPVYSFD